MIIFESHVMKLIGFIRVIAPALFSVLLLTDVQADDIAPFPPGENAALVKKTCTECHGAGIILSTQFDAALARRQYKLFVGDPDSDEGQKVIKYLTTALGPK